MSWTIQKLIRNQVKKPIRRLYIKRAQRDGTHESSWTRVDTLNSINRMTNWGKVNFSIDGDQYIINAWDISTCEMTVTNADGKFNSNADYRSLWFYTQDFKDTKIKIVVAMEDPDGNEVGTVDAFEGSIIFLENIQDNEAKITIADYSKKLVDFSFPDLAITGSQLASTILTAIFADTQVTNYLSGTITLSPVHDCTIDTTTNDVFTKSYWDVVKFLAEKTGSTILVKNTNFFFGTRESAGTTADWTFRGVGNTQDDRTIDIYEPIVFDQGGTDKLYTRIVDSSDATKFVESTNAELLRVGKTKTLDLTDAAAGDKLALLNAYLAYFGHKRPTIKLPSTVFMMMLLFPFDLISIDNPGAQTESNAGVYDVSTYDSTVVYDGDGGSCAVWPDVLFSIESIDYDFNEWETTIFSRMQI